MLFLYIMLQQSPRENFEVQLCDCLPRRNWILGVRVEGRLIDAVAK